MSDDDAVLVEHEHLDVSPDTSTAAVTTNSEGEEINEGKNTEEAEKKEVVEEEVEKNEDTKKEGEKEGEEKLVVEAKVDQDKETDKKKEGNEENVVKDKNDEDDDDDTKEDELKPCSLQIVSIGTEEDAYAFSFHEKKFSRVLDRIPAHAKVAVVSVVGAFRTGKSFLLSWFLRYLSYCTTMATTVDEPLLVEETADGKNDGGQKKWYETFTSLGHDGFEWKAGSQRNTTGIWVWSHPFMLKDNLAVLLIDTQGMFDHETTMSLTASIFGLSTLLSSYQIYNVDKRIQEDNLQQLALFSEYARTAMKSNPSKNETDDGTQKAKKPFQRVEFLVRDWQHFEEEDSYDEMEASMNEYLAKVISERDADDLQQTREQITDCFDAISCFALCHPGFAVTKKKYSGDVHSIEPQFIQLLDRYCERVFHDVDCKIIHGQQLSAAELGTYVRTYAGLFASGANFPEASTMLEATASANNVNALNNALQQYKATMDRIVGPDVSNYLTKEELMEQHRTNRTSCVEMFDRIANFGSSKSIQKSKRNLLEKIDSDFEMYDKLNESRNPLAGFEVFVVPVGVALVAYVLRAIFDWTCAPWSQICKVSSSALGHVYAVVFCFFAIVAATKAKQIHEIVMKVKAAIELVMNKSNTPPLKAKTD